MFKILYYSRKGLFFFKRIKIGIHLVKNSFKSIFFDHKKYFIFCITITIILLSKIILMNLIDPQLSLSILISEFLTGQSFFNVIFNYRATYESYSIELFIIKTILFFFEFLIISYISIVLISYSDKLLNHEETTHKTCFINGLKKFRILIKWSIINVLFYFLFAVTGFIGIFLEFFWQIGTSLSLQIIFFENKNILQVLMNSFKYLKKMFGNFLGIDFFINIILITLSSMSYYLLKSQIQPTFNFLNDFKIKNILLIVLMFYLISVVIVSEVMTFTALFKIMKQNNLKKKNKI